MERIDVQVMVMVHKRLDPLAINDNHFKSFVDILDNEDIMGVLRETTDNQPRWVHHFDIHKSFGGVKVGILMAQL